VKKFIQFLSASLVGMTLMVGVAGAAATSSCPTGTIENTGPGSTNTITCTTTTDTHVTCVNDIYVVGENGQQANSGTGTNDGNTTSGSVVTGNATNDNNQTVQVGASCGAAAVATTTPATVNGGMGAAVTSTPAATPPAPAAAKVASLPDTGSNAALDASVAGVAIVGTVLAVSQFGMTAYRRLALK
jgi:hypothetical protein